MHPLVSIIIPTYNRSQLIHQRALKSALAQRYANKQIIVIDDGSTEPYNIQLPAWYYKPWEQNKGGSAARNYGVTQAKGTYIVFIDDDNILDPLFLMKTVPILEGEDGHLYEAVSTGRKVVYDDYAVDVLPRETDFPAIDWGWLLRREVFDKIRYDESIWGDEDADFGIQFMKAGFEYTTTDYILGAAYALREQDATANTLPTVRRLRGLRNFLDKNLSEYTDPNERRYILRLAGRNYYRGGHRLQGLRYFWQSFRAQPGLKSFSELCAILCGWYTYDKYMSYYERRRV